MKHPYLGKLITYEKVTWFIGNIQNGQAELFFNDVSKWVPLDDLSEEALMNIHEEIESEWDLY